MYYPPGPGFPQGRAMMGYGGPGMMPPRPRYPPANGQVAGIPIPAPYGQPGQPQGYGMSGYPRAAPRPPAARGPPSPTSGPAPIPRAGGPPPVNGAPRPPVPQAVPQGIPPQGAPQQARPPAAAAPGPAGSRLPTGQQPGYQLKPQTRNAPAAAGSSPAAQPAAAAVSVQQPAGPNVTANTLAASSPMEQKQMLGEVIYMKIADSEPELAGKITGMLLEMDNSELLNLLDSPDAMEAKVNEALAVLHEFSNKATDA